MARYLLMTITVGLMTWGLVAGCTTTPGGSGNETECSNFADDDGDGQVDCDDPDCVGHIDCGRENDCDDGQDNDGDGDIDCNDSDCRLDAVCEESGPDGDADADEDLDEDLDEDEEEEVVDAGEVVNGGCCGEITLGPECSDDCSDFEYRTRCERGDCSEGGETRDCCVARFCTCCATVTVGDVYRDLQVNFRGMYDNNHRCGYEGRYFVITTRGAACEDGFIRIQIRVPWNLPDIGEERRLCGDTGLGDYQIVATVQYPDGEQVNYRNMNCASPGTLIIHDRDDTSVTFSMRGTLPELDRDYQRTGRDVDIDLDVFMVRDASGR